MKYFVKSFISRHALRHHSESERAWKSNFKEIAAERAKRLRFDGKKWSEDLIQIKMEANPFNQGDFSEQRFFNKQTFFTIKRSIKISIHFA